MKEWRCSVCGYIHKGDEPPETCPVCGADRTKFVEIIPEAAVETKTEVKEERLKFEKILDQVMDLMTKHHAHPIAVHIPNGVLPLCVLLTILAVIFQSNNLQLASFYNVIFVLITMPWVLFSGYVDWKKRYNSALTTPFFVKMICGALVTLASFILVVWQIANPNIVTDPNAAIGPFIFIHLVLLAAAGVAGFFGGKVVFKD